MVKLWSYLGQRLPLVARVHSAWLMTLMLFLAVAGCSAPVISSRSAPTRTPFPTPEVIPTITPNETATPFPSVPPVETMASWKNEASGNWAGLTFPISDVTGVQAQWREPTVIDTTGEPAASELIFVGIGGWGGVKNLIQVGTFVYFQPESTREEGVFYEMVPAQPYIQPPAITVAAGDYLFAEVVEVSSSPQRWRLLLVDANNGSTFDRTVQFDSARAYPDIIVEDPGYGSSTPPGASSGNPYHPFPTVGIVAFSNVQIRIGSAWVPAASRSPDVLDMRQNDHYIASASPMIRSSSFTVTQAGL